MHNAFAHASSCMKQIKLNNKVFCIVDDGDYKWLSKYHWSFSGRCAQVSLNKKHIKMHRMIMNTPKGLETDHINGDPLDNRRSNLRICTHAENIRNRKKNKNSLFKGVYFDAHNKKWIVQIGHGLTHEHLGRFDDPVVAAKAYDKRAKEKYGEFSRLNFE